MWLILLVRWWWWTWLTRPPKLLSCLSLNEKFSLNTKHSFSSIFVAAIFNLTQNRILQETNYLSLTWSSPRADPWSWVTQTWHLPPQPSSSSTSSLSSQAPLPDHIKCSHSYHFSQQNFQMERFWIISKINLIDWSLPLLLTLRAPHLHNLQYQVYNTNSW